MGGIFYRPIKEIKDVLAYLKTIDNAKDDIAVRRIINVPKRGIGPGQCKPCTGMRTRDHRLYEALMGVNLFRISERGASKWNPLL